MVGKSPSISSREKPDSKVSLGILGLIISFSFLMIEKRNAMLVNDGRAALEALEKDGPLSKVNIRAIDKQKRKELCWKLISHTFWFRIIMLALMICSIFAIAFPIGFKLSECCWFLLVVLLLFAIALAFPCFESSYELPIDGVKPEKDCK